MRLGYFTMPVHPMHRVWSETLKEDREAIILADRLGFHDAFAPINRLNEVHTLIYESYTSAGIFSGVSDVLDVTAHGQLRS